MNSYNNIEALLAPVKSGAIAPVSGQYLIKLAAGCRVLRQKSGLTLAHLVFQFRCHSCGTSVLERL